MKKKINAILDNQDHFGITPNYYIKGKSQLHLLSSQIMSILLNGASIAMFVVLLIELISKDKPNVNNVTLHNGIAPNVTLNKEEDLIIAVGLLTPQYELFDPTGYVELQAKYEISTNFGGEFSNRIENLPRINCTDYNLKLYQKYGFEDEFYSNSLDEYSCYNLSELGNIPVLGGSFGSDYYGVLTFDVAYCNGDGCRPHEEIKKTIQGCWFEMFFLDHYADIYNYTTPIQTFASSTYISIDSNLMKTVYSYFSEINIFNDNGLIFSNEKKISSFKLESQTTGFDSNEYSTNDLVLSFTLLSSSKTENYYRSYIKIQGICANVGGIVNGIHIVGGILLAYFQKRKYHIELIDMLFEWRHSRNPEKISTTGLFRVPFDQKCKTSSSNFTRRQSTKKVSEWYYFFPPCFCNKSWHIIEFKKEFDKLVRAVKQKLELSSAILLHNEVNIIREVLAESDLGYKFDTFGYRKFKWGVSMNKSSATRLIQDESLKTPSTITKPKLLEKYRSQTNLRKI